MAKRQRVIEGAIYAVPINGGKYYVYSQAIVGGDFIFFDYRSKELIKDVSVLQNTTIICRAFCHTYQIVDGSWPRVGKLPLCKEHQTRETTYIFDIGSDLPYEERFSLYNPDTGKITKCTIEEARGLRCTCVSDPVHIEERIKTYYRVGSIVPYLKACELMKWDI